MHCPHCHESSLRQQVGEQGTIVDICSTCHGLWLDCGEIYDFSSAPQRLDQQLIQGLSKRRPSSHLCPRCQCNLEEGMLSDREIRAETCPSCGGLWFAGNEVRRVNAAGSGD